MRHSRMGLVVGGLLAAMPSMLSAQASTQVIQEERPFSSELEHPCTGDIVTLTGTVQVAYRTTVDAQGMTHWTYNLVPFIEGIGTSGATYKVVGGERDHRAYVTFEGDPFSASSTLAFNVIGPSGTPNFILTTTSRLKIAADGTVELLFFKENGHCTGP
jgi:hypothetical protein